MQRIEWHRFDYSVPEAISSAAPVRPNLGAHVCKSTTLPDGSVALFWWSNDEPSRVFAPTYYAVINSPERP